MDSVSNRGVKNSRGLMGRGQRSPFVKGSSTFNVDFTFSAPGSLHIS